MAVIVLAVIVLAVIDNNLETINSINNWYTLLKKHLLMQGTVVTI